MTYEEATGLLKKYYPEDSEAFRYIFEHSEAVSSYALRLAKMHPELKPDIPFIRSSAMLHDIGIFMTYAPGIGCTGEYPYLAHGYLGRELLEKEGYPRHALVCERHVGVGISREDILSGNLPLPPRDMLPISVEEEIVCYADLYFSKKPGMISTPKAPEEIMKKLEKWGPHKPAVFRHFLEKYGTL
jgi:uncharacterized protein